MPTNDYGIKMHTGCKHSRYTLLSQRLACYSQYHPENFGSFRICTIRFRLGLKVQNAHLLNGRTYLQHDRVVKGKGQYICIAPYCRQPTSKALRYGNALSRDLTVLPAHPRVLSANGMNHTCQYTDYRDHRS